MCLYPRLIKNKKYLPNKKNGYNPPECPDERLMYVPVKCGECEECKKAEYREWRIRLEKEIQNNPMPGKFVTLTFNQEALNRYNTTGKEKDDENAVTIAVRHFLERWRKKTGRSPKHWLITERGEDYARIHLHGIIFTNQSENFIKETWGNGFVYIGDYCNLKTINYITKYVLKKDRKHPNFKSKKYVSAGIGKDWLKMKTPHLYKGEKTQESIRLDNGVAVQMPIYFRNKVYSEHEREELWLKKIEKNKRFLKGIEFDMNNPREKERFFRVLERMQNESYKNGYGAPKEWNAKKYGNELEKLVYRKKSVY